METLSYATRKILIGLIRVYQLVLSPVLGPGCRLYPSCSAYATEAIRRHGPARGLVLTVRRLCRCHPWGPAWQYDPVPTPKTACAKGQARSAPETNKSVSLPQSRP